MKQVARIKGQHNTENRNDKNLIPAYYIQALPLMSLVPRPIL